MENSPTTKITWYYPNNGPMQKILERNAIALSEKLNSDIEVGRRQILVWGESSVVIKAKMEKLISENKMDKGTITQFKHCVLFEPKKTVRDNYYKS